MYISQTFFVALILFASTYHVQAGRSGKCYDRSGAFKCKDGIEVCMTKTTLCDPPDMSKKCKCKKIKVKGCQDQLGSLLCKSGEECLENGNPCTNTKSKRCACAPAHQTPAPPPSGGPSCFVNVDAARVNIPFDRQFHDIPGLPCKECMCMPRPPVYIDFCRNKPNCNAAFQLANGKK